MEILFQAVSRCAVHEAVVVVVSRPGSMQSALLRPQTHPLVYVPCTPHKPRERRALQRRAALFIPPTTEPSSSAALPHSPARAPTLADPGPTRRRADAPTLPAPARTLPSPLLLSPRTLLQQAQTVLRSANRSCPLLSSRATCIGSWRPPLTKEIHVA